MRKIIKQKCPKCRKVLQLLEYGKGEIKCPRCGQIITYEYKRGEEYRVSTKE